MPSDHVSEELKIFFDEAVEILELLEESLMIMERDGVTQELIQELFRAAHTLKGSSATAGFHDMATVTHHLENVLALARENDLAIETETIDIMLETVDWLRACKDGLQAGSEVPDPTGVVARLELLASAGSGSSDAHKPGSPGKKASQEACPPGSRCVTVVYNPDEAMLPLRMYQTVLALESLGTVKKSVPSLEEIETERTANPLHVFLTAEAPAGAIESQISSIPGVREVVVGDVGAAPASVTVPISAPDRAQGPQGLPAAPVAPQRQAMQTVRVDVSLIDSLMNLVGELIIDRTRLTQIAVDLSKMGTAEEISANLSSTVSHLYRITGEIQEGIMRARLMPLKNLLKKYPRMVRDLALKSGKEVEFSVMGEDTELDRSVIEALDDPLIHLLRNSIDHGLETPESREACGKPRQGRVSITASHQENHVVVVVSDDGKGIDPERIRKAAAKKGLVSEDTAAHLTDEQAVDLIFMPGFSTSEKVNETSGRGVGLDVVRTNLKRINGALNLETQVGKGTRFVLKLPLTLAIVKALLVNAIGETYAIPVSAVQEVVELESKAVKTIAGKEVVIVRDSTYPLMRLNRLFSRNKLGGSRESKYAVIATTSNGEVAIGVEGISSEQEIVVKSLGKLLGNITGISGATILGQGDVALILDIHALLHNLGRVRIA